MVSVVVLHFCRLSRVLPVLRLSLYSLQPVLLSAGWCQVSRVTAVWRLLLPVTMYLMSGEMSCMALCMHGVVRGIHEIGSCLDIHTCRIISSFVACIYHQHCTQDQTCDLLTANDSTRAGTVCLEISACHLLPVPRPCTPVPHSRHSLGQLGSHADCSDPAAHSHEPPSARAHSEVHSLCAQAGPAAHLELGTRADDAVLYVHVLAQLGIVQHHAVHDLAVGAYLTVGAQHAALDAGPVSKLGALANLRQAGQNSIKTEHALGRKLQQRVMHARRYLQSLQLVCISNAESWDRSNTIHGKRRTTQPEPTEARCPTETFSARTAPDRSGTAPASCCTRSGMATSLHGVSDVRHS